MHTHAATALNSIGEVGPHVRAWRDAGRWPTRSVARHPACRSGRSTSIALSRSVQTAPTSMRIADALDVPFRERNTLLLAAGYAPVFDDAALSDQQMAPVTKALRQMLDQHEPFPAFVLDRYWNVTMRNDAVRRFFSAFFDLDAYPEPRNLLQLMLIPRRFGRTSTIGSGPRETSSVASCAKVSGGHWTTRAER